MEEEGARADSTAGAAEEVELKNVAEELGDVEQVAVVEVVSSIFLASFFLEK